MGNIILNGLAPSYLTDQFQSNSTLRYGGANILLPKPNTEYFKKSCKFSGAKLWNELPKETKLQDTLGSFKLKIPSFS